MSSRQNNNANVYIIGAGPSGLALAACLKSNNIAFQLIDNKGVVGGAFNHMYEYMRMASPARYMSLPGLTLKHDSEYIRAGEYLQYLRQYAAHFDLSVQAVQVRHVEPANKDGEGFLVYSQQPTDEACDNNAILDCNRHTQRFVVLATGMFDTPVYADELKSVMRDPPLGLTVIHAHDWRGVEQWQGKSVLLLGSATSAVDIAEEFAAAGQLVHVSTRSGRFNSIPQRVLGRDIHDMLVPLARLPRWLLRRHCRHYYESDAPSARPRSEPATHVALYRYLDEGLIKLVEPLTSINGRLVGCGNDFVREFDVIISATGYRYNYDYLRFGMDVEDVLADVDRGESKTWPGLFLMGKGCVFGRPSQFIWGIAHDAKRLATIISSRIDRASH